MPPIPSRNSETPPDNPVQPKRLKSAPVASKFRCPSCYSIHHFDAQDGCHNRSCGYKGKLEPLLQGAR